MPLQLGAHQIRSLSWPRKSFPFQSLAFPFLSRAFRGKTLPMRCKATLFRCGSSLCLSGARLILCRALLFFSKAFRCKTWPRKSGSLHYEAIPFRGQASLFQRGAFPIAADPPRCASGQFLCTSFPFLRRAFPVRIASYLLQSGAVIRVAQPLRRLAVPVRCMVRAGGAPRCRCRGYRPRTFPRSRWRPGRRRARNADGSSRP